MKKLLALAISAIVSTTTFASLEKAESNFKKKYPNTTITSIGNTPIDGIYEVVLGKNIAYTDISGDFFIFGSLVRMSDQTDLTQIKREELNKINFSDLPLDKAIAIKKGKGERKIAVFSDPDCPFCKRLEQELHKLDNVTIYIFLNPLKQLHPQAVEISQKIWCSKDRALAWKDYMLGGISPTGNTTCNNPVNETVKLAQQLGINGTPTSFLVDGSKITGAKTSSELDYALTRATERAAAEKAESKKKK
jgi:thiol:disulfide interchange protein DsbC